MPKKTFDNYYDEIRYQQQVWSRKGILRLQYRHWYRKIVQALAPHEPVIEMGSGCGNFKEYYPACTATDVLPVGHWIDRIVDAQRMDFSADSVGNLVAIDVVHHLQRPLGFLRQAEHALRPGGRLVLCEPAMTPWSRLVYGRFHHEPVNMAWDLFGLDDTPQDADPGHTFANAAIGEILFWKQRACTLARLPLFTLRHASKFGFMLYPLTGGFGYRSYLPCFGFARALRIEDALLRPFASWLTGLRMLVVLEKRSDASSPPPAGAGQPV